VIGILLSEMPRMLHDVIGNVIGVEPDLRVVAHDVETGALLERVERERPDVVMLCAESESPPAMCEQLLGRFPQLAVVALEEQGLRGSIYMMRPIRFRVAEISSAQLVTAIRRAAEQLPFPASVLEAGVHVSATVTWREWNAGLPPITGPGTAQDRKRGGWTS
jgi:DNA-binding NarL/FixJ family response regulator